MALPVRCACHVLLLVLVLDARLVVGTGLARSEGVANALVAQDARFDWFSASESSASRSAIFASSEPLLEIAASNDGYVESKDGSRDKAFFTNAHLVTSAFDRQAFLQFEVPTDSATIASTSKVRKAELVLKQTKDSCVLSEDAEQYHELREVSSPWTVTGLTYDARPSLGAEPLARWSPNGVASVLLDITEHVKSKDLSQPLLFALRTDVDKWCSYGASNSDKATPSLWPVLRLWFEDGQLWQADTAKVPDFSRAGYHHGVGGVPELSTRGWKVFNVDDFGSSTPGSAEPAIRAAIAAAEAHVGATKGSGAVIQFAAHEYRINTATDKSESILVTKPNIVWRGAGAGTGGTTIFMENAMKRTDPNEMASTPFKIIFGNTASIAKAETLAAVTGAHSAETMSLTVDPAGAAKLRAGMWVTLKAMVTEQKSAAFVQMMQGMTVRPKWKDTLGRLRIHEHHQVEAVSGDTVTFKEPIHVAVDVASGGDWHLAAFNPVEEVGVEGIAFKGSWTKEFHHHLSSKHDGGMSMLMFSEVANAYVRDVAFENVNRALELKNAVASSVLFTQISGNRGHTAVSILYSSHNFVGFSRDVVGQYHSFGVSHHSSGNVYHRVEWAGNTAPELQARQPHTNLYDNAQGGWAAGHNGGAEVNLPNHLAGLTLWNMRLVKADAVHTTDSDGERVQGFPLFYDKNGNKGFCTEDNEDSMGCIVRPIVKGWYGAVFKDEAAPNGRSDLSEGFAWPVSPPSLYEAQVMKRNEPAGDVAWLAEALGRWLRAEVGAETNPVYAPLA